MTDVFARSQCASWVAVVSASSTSVYGAATECCAVAVVTGRLATPDSAAAEDYACWCVGYERVDTGSVEGRMAPVGDGWAAAAWGDDT